MSILDMFNSWLPTPAVNVTAAELKQMLANKEKLQIVDVRTKAEFDSGHIKGAVLVPLDQLATRAGELNRTRDMVLVCRSGARSMSAYRTLSKMGFTNIRNMSGGMFAWEACQ